MRQFFKTLNKLSSSHRKPSDDRAKPLEHRQVIIPHSVDLPLQEVQDNEISVPASINGRNLSTGRP